MQEDKLLGLVKASQKGDKEARENLIEQCRSFIQGTAYAICGRKLDWANSDELSVALIAFNEAVSAFDPAKGAGFLTFARRVINQRLIDYFRSETRHFHLPLDSTEEGDISPHEIAQSLEEHRRTAMQEELALTMAEFDRQLLAYGTSIDELADTCPKHRDTREKLFQVAQLLCTDELLLAEFLRTKRLPAAELSRRAGVSRRVLENGRKYVVALTIIISDSRFAELKSFIELD